MYSLLMVSASGYWEARNGCNFELSRFLEYTDQTLVQRLKPITQEVAEELKKWPVLFAYELPWHDGPSDNMARLGWLTEVQQRHTQIRIGYSFDSTVPPITATQLRSILWELDIENEISRTHWAVKDVDLFNVLRKTGIIGDLPAQVSAPVLRATSEAVELALEDAELMIKNGRASNAVDRVHTVLHGYLVQMCLDANLMQNDGDRPSLTAAFKRLRENHPRFIYAGPRENEIGQALKSSATFLDAFNTLRNNASVAHPNDEVVPEPEAMYLINMARSLLHYIEMKCTIPRVEPDGN